MLNSKDTRCDYFGNAWLGLFIKTNNNITLVPNDTRERLCGIINEALGTEVIKASLASSNLIGLYSAMNSNGIVVPNSAEPQEIEHLKKHGLNVYQSKERYNAHGNNVVANDRIGLINRNVHYEEKAHIADALGVELIEMNIAGYTVIGSVCIITNKGFLVHYGTSEHEFAHIKDILKLNGEKGSVNMGAGFVGRGIIANDHGCIAGSHTSGFELGRAHSALGFL